MTRKAPVVALALAVLFSGCVTAEWDANDGEAGKAPRRAHDSAFIAGSVTASAATLRALGEPRAQYDDYHIDRANATLRVTEPPPEFRKAVGLRGEDGRGILALDPMYVSVDGAFDFTLLGDTEGLYVDARAPSAYENPPCRVDLEYDGEWYSSDGAVYPSASVAPGKVLTLRVHASADGCPDATVRVETWPLWQNVVAPG